MSIYSTPIIFSDSGGSGTIIPKNITTNGTYNAQDDMADGYSPVVVNVPTGGSDLPPLPSEYQEVEYISVTGTQYAQISVDNGDDILTDAMPTGQIGNEEGFAGQRQSNHGIELYFYDSRMLYYGAFSDPYRSGSSAALNNKYTFHCKTTYAQPEFKVGVYRPDRYQFTGRIYYLETYYYPNLGPEIVSDWHKFTRKHYLKPCYRKHDRVPGFYDLITGTFLINIGTGDFGIGPEV